MELKEKIEKVIDKINYYLQNKEVTLTPDERKLVQEIINELTLPGRRYSLGCGSCFGEIAKIISDYYYPLI